MTIRGRTQQDASTDRWARHDWWGVVLDAPDPRALVHFYAALLGWTVSHEDDDFCTLDPGEGVAYLAVQASPAYVRPTWPPAPGQQQMMLHLDVEVEELDAAVGAAVELGAVLAEHQPQEGVRVLLDPVGHPFCLYTS